jgi:hypothetical protein
VVRKLTAPHFGNEVLAAVASGLPETKEAADFVVMQLAALLRKKLVAIPKTFAPAKLIHEAVCTDPNFLPDAHGNAIVRQSQISEIIWETGELP